jgi:predicted N-acetyltransferase YhbS
VADVAVRRSEPGDLPAMAAVFRRASLSNEDDRPLLDARPDLLELAEPATGSVSLVAVSGERVVGFATASPEEGWLELVDLFVDPDEGRRGVARALVQAVAEAGRACGSSRIEVDANPHAVGFYERVGFRARREVAVEHGTAVRMDLDIDSGRLLRADPVGDPVDNERLAGDDRETLRRTL